MEGQVRFITVLGLLLVGLSLAALLYTYTQDILFKAEREVDVYLSFARLTQLNLKVLRAEYNVYTTDNNTSYLYVGLVLSNEGTEPIYYRSPILAVVHLRDDNGSENIAELHLAVDNSTGAFYPSITYISSGLTTLPDPSYRPYRVDLLLNGVTLSSSLMPSDWPFSENMYVCTDCSSCQYLLDSLNEEATILLLSDVSVDRDPCIEFSGIKNIVFDCAGHTLSGGNVVFKFQDANGFYLRNCDVKNTNIALEINGASKSMVRSISVSDSAYAVYLVDPTVPSSYLIDVQDIMYSNKKFFYFKPGYGTSFSPFMPFSIWVYGFSAGVDVDVGGTNLERAYPLVTVVNSSHVNIKNFSASTSDRFAINVLGSNDVNISDIYLLLSGSDYGIYSVNSSDLFLNRVRVTGTSSAGDLYLDRTAGILGDINVG